MKNEDNESVCEAGKQIEIEEVPEEEAKKEESPRKDEQASESAPETSESETEEAASDDGGEENAAEDKTGGKIRNPFGRKDKKELEKKEAELAELKERYLRTLAEYENFRKRSEKEKADIYSFAVRDVMTKILPVLDNLERGIAAVPEDAKDDPFAQGMDKILKQFQKTLDDIGVKPIDAAGKPFDPSFHNAVLHVDDENLGTNVVAEELQKGYLYKDTVVRHSMVKVAN